MLLILFCVLTKTFKRVRLFPMELEFERVNGFEERRKPENPKKNLSEQRREPITNSPPGGVDAKTGFKPEPH